ncbi:SAM-dependent methyltransferase [Methanobacterium spitsbergense]|nr:SAM-dependent methyltransferase [Methanobacterium spitsbergense]
MEFYLIIGMIITVTSIIISWIMWSAIIGAGFQPTSKKLVKKMLEIAEIGPNDVLYDLGSGDGRIITEAVKCYGAKAVGIEADPIRVLWSRMFLFFYRIRDKSKIKWGNFFNEDIIDATAVTLFLGSKANEKLKKKLVKELKPGTLVVSYVWTFHDWKPAKIDYRDKIYLYKIGESNL